MVENVALSLPHPLVCDFSVHFTFRTTMLHNYIKAPGRPRHIPEDHNTMISHEK